MFNIFKDKTVETITASLRKMVDDLTLHAEKHSEHGASKLEEANRLVDEYHDHLFESDKAKTIASKIGALFN